MIFWKWRYFKNGIAAHQYRKDWTKDIKDIIDIDTVMSERDRMAKELRDSMQQ